jgi:DNA modification methylase
MMLIHGECIAEMDKLIEQGIKVDAIITDPPYGTTACKWDSVIPFPEMWERLNKLIKPNGAIVLFGSEPFSSALRMSNIKNYKYDLIWDKTKSGNFALAKKQPMKSHENISIFYSKQPTYNPQMEVRGNVRKKGGGKASDNFKIVPTISFNNTYYPKSIMVHSTGSRKEHFHPTQKPVALMEYLIKTYTNEGETVLDFTMGSGSTGVACVNTNRRFIGIEMDDRYFRICEERIL